MNINEIEELALDVGMAVASSGNGYWDNSKQLSDFALAIEARTKEKCARICEVWRSNYDNRSMQGEGWAADECAAAIRAMP